MGAGHKYGQLKKTKEKARGIEYKKLILYEKTKIRYSLMLLSKSRIIVTS